MKEYRANAGFAAIAYVVAAAAGVAYGAHNHAAFAAAPALLIVGAVWATLWTAAGKEQGSDPRRLERRILVARASGTLGLALAVVLLLAAVL